ncbi:hypothetical protein [Ponticaulis sp.]|uniref:hypothetical protein n=1 Tax=Ponticaulis sp. TaxID=2020902 RepID=UPI000B6379AF|nr:hypothetical protein [Ponticaulis sp.]MAI91225.1 hypothetical protein [Ponticaulis sp.]OUX98538.1 MAG: hypothetical protein CBB65_12325 [Hyphomonadaceae bacterium TMED5]|tara:strand:- start:60756 stop:61307 length:552 start_codon:yes stop_codon:yes gene_type:complete
MIRLAGLFLLLISAPAFAQTVSAPLRAEIVSAAEITTTAVEAQEGSFGRIGVPKTGFCEYGFDSKGQVTITDSTGTYGPGETTPDGCYAPDEAEAAAFEIQCARGDTLEMKINARSDMEGVEISTSDISVEGGLLEGNGESYRLTCTSESGKVILRAGTSFTLGPSVNTGDGALGALELATEY